MKCADAIAGILKREEVETIIAYPNNPIIEAAAKKNIRTIVVRQERTGVHMADAMSRLSSGKRIGVFTMQHGPGAENAFGGVAQAYGDSVPILILPRGYPRYLNNTPPNFNSFINYRHITKWIEQVTLAATVPDVMRRAFTQLRNGRPRPVLVEIPQDVFSEDVPEPLSYAPTFEARTAPDPQAVAEAVRILLNAKHPVIYAGQGVHYAKAWAQLRDLAEMLGIPVTTSLPGKSAFPENHPLSLGACGRSAPQAVHYFLKKSDVILGMGCSFCDTIFTVPIPAGEVIIHATLDTADLNKDIHADCGLIGDAKLTLEMLISKLKEVLGASSHNPNNKVAEEIKKIKEGWMAQWMPKLKSNEIPISPYRILWDLMHTVDRANTIITHDAGAPRDCLTPFWETVSPLTYIGWGKTTQLGYSLGLAMGAKLMEPNKLCINVMGDAAIGMTGMDFETAVRNRIAILTIVINNSFMALSEPSPIATEKYHIKEVSGNYAEMARAFCGYSERITQPDGVIPAIKRAVKQTEEGTPALLEFICSKETEFSCI